MLGFRDLAFVAQGLRLPVHSTGLLLNCTVPAKVYLNQDVFSYCCTSTTTQAKLCLRSQNQDVKKQPYEDCLGFRVLSLGFSFHVCLRKGRVQSFGSKDPVMGLGVLVWVYPKPIGMILPVEVVKMAILIRDAFFSGQNKHY